MWVRKRHGLAGGEKHERGGERGNKGERERERRGRGREQGNKGESEEGRGQKDGEGRRGEEGAMCERARERSESEHREKWREEGGCRRAGADRGRRSLILYHIMPPLNSGAVGQGRRGPNRCVEVASARGKGTKRERGVGDLRASD